MSRFLQLAAKAWLTAAECRDQIAALGIGAASAAGGSRPNPFLSGPDSHSCRFAGGLLRWPWPWPQPGRISPGRPPWETQSPAARAGASLLVEQTEQPAHNFQQESSLLGEGCAVPAAPLETPASRSFAPFLAFPATRCVRPNAKTSAGVRRCSRRRRRVRWRFLWGCRAVGWGKW